MKVPLRGNALGRLKQVDTDYKNFIDQGLNKFTSRVIKNLYGLFPLCLFQACLDLCPGLQFVAAPSMGSSETYFLNGVPIQSVHFLASLFFSQIGK